MIEGTRLFQEKHGILVARTLNDISGTKTVVRLCNPTQEDILIRKNTNVGICEPITCCLTESSNNIDINQISIDEDKVQDDTHNCTIVPQHLEALFEQSTTHLETEEQAKLLEKLVQYQDVFACSDTDLGRTGQVTHKIETGDAKPIRQKPRRMPIHMRDEVDKIMENMIDQGIIEPSCSPWQSPVVLVCKPDNSQILCGL